MWLEMETVAYDHNTSYHSILLYEILTNWVRLDLCARPVVHTDKRDLHLHPKIQANVYKPFMHIIISTEPAAHMQLLITELDSHVH